MQLNQGSIVWASALSSGELISPEMYVEQVNAIPVDDSGAFGYGPGVTNPSGMIAHNGAINGFHSAVASSPGLDISIAVRTNCNPIIGMGDAALEIVAELIGV